MKEFNINSLLRPHIATLKPYSSARDEYSGEAAVFLDANENPNGSVNGGDYNRYPDPLQKELKEKLSELKQVPPANIFFGNGSDEAIDLLFRAFARPGIDNVVILPPTYGMYEVSAAINDIEVRTANLTDTFQLNTGAILKAVDENTKMVFVCSPNNPTGNLMESALVDGILKEFKGLVVVDEAYIDFADTESFTKKLAQFPNLVVLQTLSKAWGLAALRCGIAFAAVEIIAILNKIKPPYNIGKHTQQAALDALHQEGAKNEMVKEIIRQRGLLSEELSKLKIVAHIYPSDANFLLVKVDNAKAIYQYLLESKIVVRDRSRVILCQECLRITVGTAEENKSLIETLKGYKV